MGFATDVRAFAISNNQSDTGQSWRLSSAECGIIESGNHQAFLLRRVGFWAELYNIHLGRHYTKGEKNDPPHRLRGETVAYLDVLLAAFRSAPIHTDADFKVVFALAIDFSVLHML